MIEQMMAFGGEFAVASVKTLRGREGHGFECVLLRNGKTIGHADDYADGGPVRISIKEHADYVALKAAAMVKLPNDKYEPDCNFINAMVNYYLTVKQLKTAAKKKMLCLDPDNKDLDDNGIQQSYTAFKMEDTPENRKLVTAKFPTMVFLNDAINAVVLPKAKA